MKVEEAVSLLMNLVDQIEEDVSSEVMSRHLKDAILDAKRYLGVEVSDDDDEEDNDNEE